MIEETYGNRLCSVIRRLRTSALLYLSLFHLCSGIADSAFSGEESVSRAAKVDRVLHDIEFLSSDALEGRGIDTPGIETAAQHIIREYERIGLKPGMPDGSFRQPFQVTIGEVVVSENTAVVLKGPNGLTITPRLVDEYQPIRRGATGKAVAGLTFIGYGITSEEDKYDDYSGISVEGRIVVLIRREPHQKKAGGAFKGPQVSNHSYIDRKLQLLADARAAGIIFVNDPFQESGPDIDELTPPNGFGTNGSGVPFVHVRQAIIDQILDVTPLTANGRQLRTLRDVASYIDETLQPVSQELSGWSAEISTEFLAKTISTDNLIGVVEGEGEYSGETIVIGGHYDHLGYGGFGSRSPGRKGEIHNGADDNASGTAAVLELARRVANGPKPQRRMVFICFSAEERGLLGSAHYVRHPAFPLDQTVFMLNFDMIGNLRGNRVEVNGVGSATEFAELVMKADQASPLDVTIVENPFGGSDHLPFYQKQIPVMFCFTGLTGTYHTPDDDFAGLNIEGVVDVVDYSELLLNSIDQLKKRPTYQEVSRSSRRQQARLPFLGIQPELTDENTEGILVRAVRPDSPAKSAGIQVGDVIIRVGDRGTPDYAALLDQLGKAKPGDTWKVVVRRDATEMELSVELGTPRGP